VISIIGAPTERKEKHRTRSREQRAREMSSRIMNQIQPGLVVLPIFYIYDWFNFGGLNYFRAVVFLTYVRNSEKYYNRRKLVVMFLSNGSNFKFKIVTFWRILVWNFHRWFQNYFLKLTIHCYNFFSVCRMANHFLCHCLYSVQLSQVYTCL
jgi:hypothetical protein